MGKNRHGVSSPWVGIICIAIALAFAWEAVGVLNDGVVVVKDGAGVIRTFRDEYAGMYAWCNLAVAAVLAGGGVVIVVRWSRRSSARTVA